MDKSRTATFIGHKECYGMRVDNGLTKLKFYRQRSHIFQ